MRNLVCYSSSVENDIPYIDMAILLSVEFEKHKRVLNRWVDYLPFEQRRVLYDTLYLPQEESLGMIMEIPGFKRYITLNDLADIMRYEFVADFGKYLDNSVFCAFVYKHGNMHEIVGWNTSNFILECDSKSFSYSTSRDIYNKEWWGYLSQDMFEKWIDETFTFS